MPNRNSKPPYTPVDPAHLFDGLFIPTSGQKRDRSNIPPRIFGNSEISFKSYEQLGANDQSVFLAISAQLATDNLKAVIKEFPKGEMSKELRIQSYFESKKDDGAGLAIKETSLYSLARDAGYKDYYNGGTAIQEVKKSLKRLRTTFIEEYNKKTGWDRMNNLIASTFNHETGKTYIAANPRLTKALFNEEQYIMISLTERYNLESEVAKILHCWLSSNIRLGGTLGKNGVNIDTLGPHIWGEVKWKSADRKLKSKRRGLIKDALYEIADCTKNSDATKKWNIDMDSSGLVLITRPKQLISIADSKTEFTEE